MFIETYPSTGSCTKENNHSLELQVTDSHKRIHGQAPLLLKLM